MAFKLNTSQILQKRNKRKRRSLILSKLWENFFSIIIAKIWLYKFKFNKINLNIDKNEKDYIVC